MRFRVHAFAVEAEVFGDGVEESSLMGWHWFESEPFFGLVCGEDSDLPLLRLGPFDVLPEHFQSVVRVWDMIVLVGLGVNIKCQSQFTVPQEPGALFVTFETLLGVSFARLGSIALHFLLQMLAFACDEHFVLARLIFTAR